MTSIQRDSKIHVIHTRSTEIVSLDALNFVTLNLNIFDGQIYLNFLQALQLIRII